MIPIPSMVVPKTGIASGAGYLLRAPLGTAEPDWTVAGSVFTGAWVGWTLFGITKEGSEFTYDYSSDNVEAAEYFDPISIVTTGRSASIKFELMLITATMLKNVLNGGTLATAGAGATLRTTYTPPAPGAEVRCMIGWEAQDNTERLIAEQALQVGSLSVPRRKGADVATLNAEYKFEIASSGVPFRYETAGTMRG